MQNTRQARAVNIKHLMEKWNTLCDSYDATSNDFNQVKLRLEYTCAVLDKMDEEEN